MANHSKKDPAYLREQGSRKVYVKQERRITFCLSKHIKGEGQSIDEWSNLDLLAKLLRKMQQCGQHSVHEIRQKKWIKEYSKVSFPPNSKFTHPKHISEVTWAVMHITDNSKEVVVGFVEDDVFYLVFLDKDHEFWPTKKKNT